MPKFTFHFEKKIVCYTENIYFSVASSAVLWSTLLCSGELSVKLLEKAENQICFGYKVSTFVNIDFLQREREGSMST